MIWGRALAAAFFVPALIFAQTIVSARSGVVNFFEGKVSIDGQPLEPKFGHFYDIKPGSELTTAEGRAEVLLTPGVMLRMGANSAIRMVSNRLSDTRLEFLSGEAALDSRNAAPGAPIVITYKNYQMRFARSGRYNMDAEPGELRVEEGEADVTYAGKTATAKPAEVIPFSSKLVARADQDRIPAKDALDRWADERSNTLEADNSAAADSDDLSSQLNNAPVDPGGAVAGGGYGGGGGTGYSGVLQPDPYSTSSPWYQPNPWMYSSPFFWRGYVPMYIPVPIYGSGLVRNGVRIPSRTYLPTRPINNPVRSFAPIRSAAPMRSTMPVRIVAPARPAIGPVGHH